MFLEIRIVKFVNYMLNNKVGLCVRGWVSREQRPFPRHADGDGYPCLGGTSCLACLFNCDLACDL